VEAIYELSNSYSDVDRRTLYRSDRRNALLPRNVNGGRSAAPPRSADGALPPGSSGYHRRRRCLCREKKLRMTVVILDEEGQLISADRMEGASFHLERFAKGKAFTALILRDRTETAAELSKSRPDRYFGIMNMYPGEVYLVGGGVPLAIDNRLVGAVGVAGLPQGIDEKAAEAGIDAWNKYRESKKK